jgi:hypothetical protein
VRSTIRAEKAVPPAEIAVPSAREISVSTPIQTPTNGLTWQSHSFSQLQNNPARQSKQQRKGQSTLHDERRTPQAPSRDLIGPVTKPNPGEAHQLLSPNRQSNNGCRQSNLCNQQPIEQAQHQHPKDAKAQLKQSKMKAKTNNTHQRLNGIALHELYEGKGRIEQDFFESINR